MSARKSPEATILDAAVGLATLLDEIADTRRRLGRIGLCTNANAALNGGSLSIAFSDECFQRGDVAGIMDARRQPGYHRLDDDWDTPEEDTLCAVCKAKLAIIEERHALRAKRAGYVSAITRAARKLEKGKP